MTFECTDHNNYKLVHLLGEIDLSNSAEIREALLKLLNDNHSVIVSFAKLDYIDSSGMATLVEGLNIAKKKGLKLILAEATGAPLQVLELTRLNQVFTMVNTLDEVTD